MKKEPTDFGRGKSPRSQRRYDKRRCKNPNCRTEPEYEPHDARQKFCCAQCGSDYFNDQRKGENATKYLDIDYLKRYNKTLEQMFAKAADDKGYCCLHKGYYKYEGVDLSMLTKIRINKDTGAEIHWLFDYGVEQHSGNKDFYIIHKKQKP